MSITSWSSFHTVSKGSLATFSSHFPSLLKRKKKEEKGQWCDGCLTLNCRSSDGRLWGSKSSLQIYYEVNKSLLAKLIIFFIWQCLEFSKNQIVSRYGTIRYISGTTRYGTTYQNVLYYTCRVSCRYPCHIGFSSSEARPTRTGKRVDTVRHIRVRRSTRHKTRIDTARKYV